MKKYLCLMLVTIILFAFFCSSVGVSAAQKQRELKIEDLVTDLPNATVNESIAVTDDSNIGNGEFTISWKEFENAASYSVKAFFHINYMNKNASLKYLYRNEFKTDTNSVTVSGLQKQRRYTIIVSALDADGNEIGVYHKLQIFTYPELEVEDVQDDSGESILDSDILIIVASVIGVLILIAVIVLIIVLKKTK